MESRRTYVKSPENLSRYHGEIRTVPMFSSEVERTFYYRWRNHHDISAAHQLVAKYLNLVSKIAEGYAGCGIPPEELVGEGYVGLMRAVCRFDPGVGVRFTVYATWHVREAIHEHIMRTIGMPLFQIIILCTLRGEHGHPQEIGDVTLRSAQQ